MRHLGFFIYINSCLLAIGSVALGMVAVINAHLIAGLAIGFIGLNLFLACAGMGMRMGVGDHPFPWK